MPSKILHHSVGDLWSEPTATFTVNNVPTDPTTITVRLQDAAGVESILFSGATAGLNASSTPVAKTGTGVYKLNPGPSLTASGYWYCKFEGTAGVVATIQWECRVDPDEFTGDAGISTRALVGLAETKDWLQQQNVEYGSDLELVGVINDVSDRIHYEAGREFKPKATNPATRTFEFDSYARCVYVGDLAVLSTASDAVQIYGWDWTTLYATVASTDVRGLPLVRDPWEPIRKLEFSQNVPLLIPGMQVQVKGTWGFPSVPPNIRRATLDTIAEISDRDVEHYRTDLGSGVTGSEAGNTIVLSSRPTILSLPPMAYAVVRSYRDLPA